MGCGSSFAACAGDFTGRAHAPAGRFHSIDALLASIASGEVRLLRGSYICELAKSHTPLTRRQELPDRAFFDHAELLDVLHKLHDEFSREDKLYEDGRVFENGGDSRFMMLLHALSYRW